MTGIAMARRSKEKQRFGNAQTGIDRRGVARPGGAKYRNGRARRSIARAEHSVDCYALAQRGASTPSQGKAMCGPMRNGGTGQCGV